MTVTDALGLELGARGHAIGLQGLTFQPTDAVVAAATTSLPEKLGDDLNFDYRYAWPRDLSLTIRSLWIAACPDEANRITLADRAAATWREPDAGMWEARDQRRQYVSSKVMCWVALDRLGQPP